MIFHSEPYVLPGDGVVSDPCTMHLDSTASLVSTDDTPFHERFCSEFARSFRAPHLSEKQWAEAERQHEGCETGRRIQVHAMAHSVNIMTMYMIQRLPTQWKRIIVSYRPQEEHRWLHS